MIDERAMSDEQIEAEFEKFLDRNSVYDLIYDQFTHLGLAKQWDKPLRSWTNDARALLSWSPFSRRKRVPMTKEEMTALVDKWHAGIRGVALAHDRESLDRSEWKSEDHMRPLFDAPRKQVREFYKLLVARLKADPSIPYWLWSAFDLHASLVGTVTKKEKPGLTLRDDVAQQIAQAVAPMILDQLPEALANSLRWRDKESLEKVNAAVKSGQHIPKLRGKESCLFLEVGEEVVMI